MHHFPFSFTYAGSEYTGFIQPHSGSIRQGKPVVFYVYINGSVWVLTYIFDFYLADRPELSEPLGDIIISWWDGVAA